jgi:DnaK suppressor protein
MDSDHKLNLSYFEKILTENKEDIIKNIDSLKREVNTLGAEDEIDDIEDMAELQINNTVDQSQLKRLETELAEVDEAINRIHAGVYGICETTGKKIPIARLLANPTARTVVGA